MLFQNCARSLSALCARFVAERAQSLSSVFPRFSLAAAFAAGRSLLSSSSAQLTCRSCEAFDRAMGSSSTVAEFAFGVIPGRRLLDCPGRHSTRSRVSLFSGRYERQVLDLFPHSSYHIFAHKIRIQLSNFSNSLEKYLHGFPNPNKNN